VRFRPCIDLHGGKVKQLVGGTLSDADPASTVTNFESPQPPSFYADLYWRDGLEGGHVIMLGPGNEAGACEALGRHPGSLQVGGGVTPDNAARWLAAGAAKVIVTSYLFENSELSFGRLEEMRQAVGRERLVVDLSCRRQGEEYRVACNRWQTLTGLTLGPAVLARLAGACSELLIHAVEVEGRQGGVDEALVARLAEWTPLPTTYAGGVRHLADVLRVRELGRNRLDVTVGSALDLFGGRGITYRELVEFDRGERAPQARIGVKLSR
jgi:phosphoribosylformimino-5-aminoimidazole carboxamide ribotide isomerase